MAPLAVAHGSQRCMPPVLPARSARSGPTSSSCGAGVSVLAARRRGHVVNVAGPSRHQRGLHVSAVATSMSATDHLQGAEAVSSSLDAVQLAGDPRFLGVQRLYGAAALARLQAAHVCVVGVGGVGSWAAEALARCGVGQLTLVDLDEVCITNVNRQIHALQHTVGRSKCAVMQERIAAINPSCRVRVIEDFLTADSAERILSHGYDLVLDAIDFADHKAELIAFCCAHRLPVVSTGGTGGQSSPFAITMADLTDVEHNKLLAATRKRLRKSMGFPAGLPNNNKAKEGMQVAKWHVPCVYIPENLHPNHAPKLPTCFPLRDRLSQVASPPPDDAGPTGRMGCVDGAGSAVFVTGGVGFFAASYIVAQLAAAPSTKARKLNAGSIEEG